MQNELNADYSWLAIELLGVNESGHESQNESFSAGRDIPWLQDVDSDGDGESDAWLDWEVELRDLVIVDRENFQIATLNLTTHSLSLPANYDMLRQLLVDAATIRGDLNRDGIVNLRDVHPFSMLLGSGGYLAEGDFNQDGNVDSNDIGPFVSAIIGR